MSGSDPHLPSRRKRLLSEEDRALWQEIAKTIKPLVKKKRVTTCDSFGCTQMSFVAFLSSCGITWSTSMLHACASSNDNDA